VGAEKKVHEEEKGMEMKEKAKRMCRRERGAQTMRDTEAVIITTVLTPLIRNIDTIKHNMTQSVRLEYRLPTNCQSVCLSKYLSVCLSTYQTVCLSVCLSVCVSICLSVCLSYCLSVRLT
jgi:hypothetical protein